MSPRRDPSESEPVAVAVIGSGASGVGAARAAAAALGPDGGAVLLVGDARPGGSARLVADGGALLECAARGMDWHAALAHLHGVRAAVEHASREAALRADGVDVVRGRARLLGEGRIAIEATGPAAADVPEVVTARRIVLATGEEDRLPDVHGLADTRLLNAVALLGLADLPPTMVVLGGGAHGCELAQALARFGVHVTLIEAADRLLPDAPPDASAMVTTALREDGVRVFTGSPAVSVAPTLDGGAWVGIGAGGDVAADGLLVATGRRAAVRGLDLPAAGVRLTGQGWIGVDDRLATTGAGVLAVGRATGLLPHGTSDPVMARVGGVNAAARRPRDRWTADGLPRVVRTEPAVGVVGLSPDRVATVAGARTSDTPYRGLERALLDDRAGLITLVAGPARASGWPGREGGSALLGATVVGPQAGELAGVAALAVRAGLTVEDLARAPLSSRTWGVALRDAAAAALVPPLAEAG